ncbi:chorismate mutase [Streptomyces sp. UNOC14_S4]|uniref:chorismate mutase n=1 Tax=Streptomyces sp. UNOC14_S4 TaxID=2872340 RepID=UPI001E6075C0|nr:chorismate mutase [Streptomyces sp. UNOC14_S4]MCC3769259.1 chorismate mutase [Streptomyces sp. UNOC14_S4]
MTALRRSVVPLVLIGSLAGCTSAPGGAGPTRPSTASAPATAASPAAEQALRALVRLAAQRVAAADAEAAAEWDTARPVDDPVREKAVLDAAEAQAAREGTDQEIVRRVFEDHIEAEKDVRRALHERWEEDPALLPAHRPGPSVSGRPAPDRLDRELLAALRAAAPLLSGPRCETVLDRDKALVARETGLDAVHGDGLDRALAHTCDS